MKLATCDEN